MKSEERHQLLTNDLGVVTTKTATFVESHGVTIASVVCGILLLAGIGFYWSQSTEAEFEEGWYRLDTAKNLDEFDEVSRKFKGTPPAVWAKLQVAEQTLQNAMPLMFTNRELALADLKSALGEYETLVHEKGVPSAVRERALWGIARCLETTCDGDTSKAIEAYQSLITEFPETIYKPQAEERMLALKKPSAAEFYGWFSKEKPKPPEIRPKDFDPNAVNLPSPGQPKDDGDDDDEKSAADKPAAEKPQTDASSAAPATNETAEKPQDTTKPADKPETEKPAEAAKPAEPEKPAATDPPKDAAKPNDKN